MSERRQFGPLFVVGFIAMMLALPPLVYYMWISVTFYGGAIVIPDAEFLSHIQAPTPLSIGLYLGWFALQALLEIVGPGKVIKGTPLKKDDTRLEYKMNGMFAMVVSIVAAVGLVYADVIPATLLYDEFGALLTTTNIFTYVFCIYIYFLGRSQTDDNDQVEPAVAGYFLGTGLNPRNGKFDWKIFCEARPGMILWVLLNASLAAKQYELAGTVTTPMILVNAFQLLYVADYFWHEPAILTTWDIKHERFGWMLAWGTLVWVPFSYTLQAQYLVHQHHELAWWAVLAIVALNMLGFAIFRGSNLQKHKFREDPENTLIWGKKPEFIDTARGTKLLTSGWWGVSRHSNYLGDLMMGLAWCLVCGFGSIIPYFYIIYFTILLVHRERRDNDYCANRYGKDWETYCGKVPYRILPGVY